MPNVRLIVEYDGAGFHGWQKQGELRTIQSELERVLGIVLGRPSGTLHAAGRTDSGVHARGQVVTFRTEEAPDLWRLAQSVSHLMKGELSVLKADIVPDSFHPGRNSTHKQYTYTILHRPAPAVLDARRVWHVHRSLDLELMQRCARELVGEHDFTSLQDSDCCAKSPIKRIYSSEVIRNGDLILYRVIGGGFLKQMVRNIVGTLVLIGRGKHKERSFVPILQAHDRREAGPTAPAHGLCMDWVSYEPLVRQPCGDLLPQSLCLTGCEDDPALE